MLVTLYLVIALACAYQKIPLFASLDSLYFGCYSLGIIDSGCARSPLKKFYKNCKVHNLFLQPRDTREFTLRVNFIYAPILM